MNALPEDALAPEPAAPSESPGLALVHFSQVGAGGLTTWSMQWAPAYVPNYGDILVCRAILNQLALPDYVQMNFGEPPPSPVTRGLVRGSTYLHGEFDFEAASRTIDAIDGPVAVVGLGAQHPRQDLAFLDGNAAARDFIARLNERGRSISVRGPFSAAIVERLGGRDIRVTGCPSLFLSGRSPRIEVGGLLDHPKRRLGISIHSDLYDNLFCRASRATKRLHGPVIGHALRNASQVSLFEQGVWAEYKVADRTLPLAERLEAARALHRHIGDPCFDEHDLVARMVSVQSIEEWLAKVRDLDAMIGFRFHGNVTGLLQGLPCYYYTYDSRLEEFCELYRLPHQPVEADWTDPVRRMLDHDWSATTASLARCRDELEAFYLENGLPLAESFATTPAAAAASGPIETDRIEAAPIEDAGIAVAVVEPLATESDAAAEATSTA
jgi:hypothetical protein